MAKFNTGDRVKLISDTENNTPMTVNTYYVDTFEGKEALQFVELDENTIKMVQCVWRDAQSQPHKEYYHEDALESC